ncbi:MAG: ABC transporter ATP-binding protein [Pseudolactococcus laudensis]
MLFFYSFSKYIEYLLAFRLELILSIIFGLASGITVVLTTYYIGLSVDQMVNQGQVNFSTLRHILTLLVGVLLVTVVSQWLIQRLSNRLSYRSVAVLRKDAYEHLNQLPLRYYDQTAHGDIVSRFTNDMDSFGYNPGQSLITDFSLKVAPGEMIVIVGKTGAGKSTLINLLMRFYDVDKGSISIDGTDIRDFTRDSLRQSFGMVLQETWLFGSSLRANLCYGREDATDDEIYAALKQAHMYDFVMRLPEKLETQIDAHALKISEGQRQLLTIARTMISEPDMLILDEATSSVDTLTEQKISQAFLTMMTGRTSFVIAHRLSTIRNADQILVLNQGQIVEIGSHDELMARHGYYYQLQQAQFAK